MTYVVTEACIKCKYMDCVEVCPVDCFYEGENMLVIHPDECIDCGVCEPECPADAIKPDTEPGLEKWLEVNAEYAKAWPNITQKATCAPRCQGMGGRSRTSSPAFSAINPGAGPESGQARKGQEGEVFQAIRWRAWPRRRRKIQD